MLIPLCFRQIYMISWDTFLPIQQHFSVTFHGDKKRFGFVKDEVDIWRFIWFLRHSKPTLPITPVDILIGTNTIHAYGLFNE